MKTTIARSCAALLTLFLSIAGTNQTKAQCSTSFTGTPDSTGHTSFLFQNNFPSNWTGVYTILYGEGDTLHLSYVPGMTSHTYYSNGTYSVEGTLYAWDPADSVNSNCTATYADTIVMTNSPCSIQLSAISMQNFGAGYFYRFHEGFATSEGSVNLDWTIFDANGNIIHTYSSGSSPIMDFIFPGSGNYSLQCIGTAIPDGCADTAALSFSIGDTTGVCNMQVALNIQPVSGLDAWINCAANNPRTYDYITVDGQMYANADTIYHTFSQTGNHTVCYYAEDSTYATACWDSICIIYDAQDIGVPCNAYFTLQQDSVNPTVWYGTNLSTGPSTMTYLWNFGDGTSSVQPALTHNYAVPGNYVICLTVTDSASGCQETHCDSSAFFSRPGSINAIGSLVITAPNIVGINEYASVLNASSIFPNPITEITEVSFNSSISASGKIEVVNMLGAVATSENVTIAKGNNEFKLNTSTLANGIYYVNIKVGDKVLSTVKAVK